MQRWWLFLSSLTIFLGLAAQPTPAQDNCYEYCTYSCPNDDTRSECTDNCVGRCGPGGDLENTWNGGSDAPYGAIAYGQQSGAFGYAFNQDTISRADHVAMSNCAQHGDDCKIVVQLTHACGAVAAGSNGTWAAEQGASKDEAQRNALASCAVNAGGACEIQAWTCSP